MLKRLLIYISILSIAFTALLWAIPLFLDWNDFRDQIADSLGERLGRDIEISGEVSFKFLPRPHLSAENLRILNLPYTPLDPSLAAALSTNYTPPSTALLEEDFLNLESLELYTDLIPLLWGDIRVRSVTLNNPIFHAQILPDGRRNWHFNLNDQSPNNSQNTQNYLNEVGSLITWLHSNNVKEAHIKNASLDFYDAPNDRHLNIDNFDAEFSSKSGYNLKGRLIISETPILYELRTSHSGEGGTLPTSLTLQIEDIEDSKAIFGGIIAFNEITGIEARGGIRLNTDNFQNIWNNIFKNSQQLDERFNHIASLNAEMIITENTINLSDISAQFGPSQYDHYITGDMQIIPSTEPEISLNLNAHRLTLDQWIPPSPALSNPQSTMRPPPPPPFILPNFIKANLTINIDSLNWNDTELGSLSIIADMQNAEINIETLNFNTENENENETGKGTEITATGSLIAREERPELNLSINANIPDLRQSLNNFNYDIPSQFASDNFRDIEGTTNLTISKDFLELDNMNIQLDNSHIEGNIIIDDKTATPNYSLNLNIDELNPDTYLSGFLQEQDNPELAESTILSPIFNSYNPYLTLLESEIFNRAKWDFNININDLLLQSRPITDAHINASLEEGAATIRNISFSNLANLSLELEGNIPNISKPQTNQLKIAANAENLAPFLDEFNIVTPYISPTTPLENFSLNAELSKEITEEISSLSLDANIKVSDTTLQVSGSQSQPLSGPGSATGGNNGNWNFRLQHPNSNNFISFFNTNPAISTEEQQPLDIYANIEITPEIYTITDLSGEAYGTSFNGNLTIETKNQPRPYINANIQTSSINIPSFQVLDITDNDNIWSQNPFTFPYLDHINADILLNSTALNWGNKNLTDLALDLNLTDNIISINQADATFKDGQIGIEATITAPNGNESATSIAATIDARNIKLTDAPFLNIEGGNLTSHLEVSSQGRHPSQIIQALNGEGSFTIEDTQINNIDIPYISILINNQTEEPQNLNNLTQNPTPISQLTSNLEIHQGEISFTPINITSPLLTSSNTTANLNLNNNQAQINSSLNLTTPENILFTPSQLQLPNEPQAQITLSAEGTAQELIITPNTSNLEEWLEAKTQSQNIRNQQSQLRTLAQNGISYINTSLTLNILSKYQTTLQERAQNQAQTALTAAITTLTPILSPPIPPKSPHIRAQNQLNNIIENLEN